MTNPHTVARLGGLPRCFPQTNPTRVGRPHGHRCCNARPAVGPVPGMTEAAIVPLFPQKERDLKKGLPSGMTAASFWASRGITKLTMLLDGKVLTDDFEGPIPYDVHTLWNVVETESDDPVAAALRKVVCGRVPSGWSGAATRALGANTAVSRSRHSLIASLRGDGRSGGPNTRLCGHPTGTRQG